MPITETFDAAVGAQALGSWEVAFRPGTQAVLGAYEPRTIYTGGGPAHNWRRDTLVVTPTWIGPNPDRSQLLAASMWSGRIERLAFGTQGWSVSGPSILAWIGDANNPSWGPGVGMYGSTLWTSTLGAYLTSISGAMNGLSWTSSGLSMNNLDVSIHPADAIRDTLNKIIRATSTPTEYRMRPDGTLLFAPRGSNFAFATTVPRVFLSDRGPVGVDGDLACYRVEGDFEIDYSAEPSSVVWLTVNPFWVVIESASAIIVDRSTRDFGGSDTAWVDCLLGVNDPEIKVADLGEILMGMRRVERLSCKVDAAALLKDLRAGDHAWVHLPGQMLWDPSEVVRVGGQQANPIKVRVGQVTQPIRRGMGVYVLHNATAAGNVVEDVTHLVEFEDGPCSVECDPLPSTRQLVRGATHRKGWDR